MKKTKFLKVCSLTLSLLIAVGLLVSCGKNVTHDGMNFAPSVEDKAEAEIVDKGFPDQSAGNTSGTPDAGSGLYERKIIRTVSMDCETKAFDDALAHMLDHLAIYNGYVQISSVKGTGYVENGKTASARIANYTLRVPAQSLDAYLAALRTNQGIRITHQSSSSNEITGTYYDITTRITTLETERDSLQQMLAGFISYEDIGALLSVQERLYNVIEEIESLKTQLKIYDDKVDLSTIEITLREVFTYTEVATPTFGERISEAFSESWQDFAHGCQDFAVVFVAALPSLVVWAVVLGVVALIVVPIIKNIKKRKTSASSDEEKS